METVFIRVTKTLLFCRFSVLLFVSRQVCVFLRVSGERDDAVCPSPVFSERGIYTKILFLLKFHPDSKSPHTASTIRLVCLMELAKELVKTD